MSKKIDLTKFKEVERKYLMSPEIKTPEDLSEILKDAYKVSYIKEFYMSDTTCLRIVDNKNWYITVKSLDTLIRDEYEFEVKKSSIDFVPAPLMEKCRYYIDFKGTTFEINLFKYLLDVEHNRPIMLVEVETDLKHVNKSFEKPYWLGEEVTSCKEFYGYNLFKMYRDNFVKNIHNM